MTTIDLRTLRIRSGEQLRETYALDPEPFELGGQSYAPIEDDLDADVAITHATSGLLFELAVNVTLEGPCFRCLTGAAVTVPIRVREYHASSGGRSDELETPYVTDDVLDLSAWARDAIGLALPDKILCRPDCAGLCPVCGKDLNAEPHEHAEEVVDPRWAALAELKDRL